MYQNGYALNQGQATFSEREFPEQLVGWSDKPQNEDVGAYIL